MSVGRMTSLPGLLLGEADVYGWTSVISGFTRASRWESASSLASQLARRRLQAHLITQNALLGGRSEGGPSGPGSAAGAGRAGRAVPASSRPWDRALQQVSIGFDAARLSFVCFFWGLFGLTDRRWFFWAEGRPKKRGPFGWKGSGFGAIRQRWFMLSLM